MQCAAFHMDVQPAFFAQLEQPWAAGVPASQQPPRFAQNKDCTWWPIFEGLNDWRIVTCVPKGDSTKAADRAARKGVLASQTEQMAAAIAIGAYGAFATDDPDTPGYYIVRWGSAPYTLQEDEQLLEFAEPTYVRAGEYICDAIYENPVPRAQLFYTPSQLQTKVCVKHVLHTDLRMQALSETVRLPPGLNKKAKTDAARKGAHRLHPDDHDLIMEAIRSRDLLDDADDGSENASEVSSSDAGSDAEDETSEDGSSDSSDREG